MDLKEPPKYLVLNDVTENYKIVFRTILRNQSLFKVLNQHEAEIRIVHKVFKNHFFIRRIE